MKYWKEKESNPVESMQFWQGTTITKLEKNEIFVMGTNPSGIHGAGAAKAGLKFGAKMTVGRGLMGATYGLITKNLEGKAGFVEKATGIVYDKEGYRSVSTEQIRANIDEMYDLAKQPEHQNKKFLVSYQYESWPNGTPKKSLNGYTSQEMLEMFVKDKDVPPNIVFHESYKPHLEKLYKNQNEQFDGELVIFEDDKTIDIKEEDVIWTIDSDERNPEARHFAGAAKSALKFGAVPRSGKTNGIARGLSPNKQTYGVITKNLTAGITVDGIMYEKEGYLSVSPEQIKKNIDELYVCAKEHPDRRFLITYKYETWPNGSPKKSLNGYTSQEMLEMFVKDKDVPPNIIFHESYKPHLEKIYSAKIKKEQETKISESTPNIVVPNELKNLYPSVFNYDEKTYSCIEHFMVYQKAKCFNDISAINIANAISEEPIVVRLMKKEITPLDIEKNKSLYDEWKNVIETIKALHKEVKNVDEQLWKEKAPNLMIKAIATKVMEEQEIKNVFDIYVNDVKNKNSQKNNFEELMVKVQSLINSMEVYKNSKQNKRKIQ